MPTYRTDTGITVQCSADKAARLGLAAAAPEAATVPPPVPPKKTTRKLVPKVEEFADDGDDLNA